MKDESILNSIISDNQLKDLAILNVVEAVEGLLADLNKREQDVLKKRFGLAGEDRETLESIGQVHKLTRERIRQIEAGGINKLKKNANLEERLGKLRQLIVQLVEEHGGLLEKNYLFNILAALSQPTTKEEQLANYFDFILSRLLNNHLDEVGNSAYFSNSYKLKYQTLEHWEAVAKELLAAINSERRLLSTAELIKLVKELPAYQAEQAKFIAPDNFEVKEILTKANQDYSDIINDERVIYSLLMALAELRQNRFGHWGHNQWREVSPKTINDKIYLVLKDHGKPMYYGDIAAKITELGFDQKKVNTATTHNELILDDKYVLVGRGLYGLQEWGYKNGTVADVIAEILKEHGALTKEEIVVKVMEQRLVKQTTINLALMNKNRFERTGDGKYKLKETKNI